MVPLNVIYIEEECRLDVRIEGNLDLSLSRDLFGLCERLDAGIRTCVVDLCGVIRLFDSGVALLKVLRKRLADIGAMLIVITDKSEMAARLHFGADDPQARVVQVDP